MAENKSKRKESFIMYESFIDAAACLGGDDFKECIIRLKDYALYGIDEPSNNQIINVILTMAKPNLDAAENRRQKQIENGMKGKEYGKLGGRPKKSDENPSKPLKGDNQKPLNVNVNEKDNDNEDDDGDGDGSVVDNPNDSLVLPSPSSSSLVPFDSSSVLSVKADNKQLQTGINPRVNQEEIEDNNRSVVAVGGPVISCGEVMSITDGLKQTIGKDVYEMFKYERDHLDFDDRYKALHVEAVKSFMAMNNCDYEKADKEIKQMKKIAKETFYSDEESEDHNPTPIDEKKKEMVESMILKDEDYEENESDMEWELFCRKRDL